MQTALLIVWLVSVFSPGHPALAKIDNENLELINYAYIRAIDNDISPTKFVRLLYGESGFNKNAKGDFRTEENRHMANGIAQYWEGTYNAYCVKKYFIQGSYLNPYSQINCSATMLGKGLWRHWYNVGKAVGFDV